MLCKANRRWYMPIFEYQCAHCGSEFELLINSSTPNITCPECTGSDVKKLFSLFAVKSGAKQFPSNNWTPGHGTCGKLGTCVGKRCSSCR